jgi:hypothetical protein
MPVPEPPEWVRERRRSALEPAPEPVPPKNAGVFAPAARARVAPVKAPRVKVPRRDLPTASVYDEPRVKPPSSGEAWRAMFSGLSLAALAPAMLAILFLFSAGAIFLSAPAGLSERSPSFRWDNLRSAIRSRAALRFEDDFRAGLSHWSGPSGWSLDWSYDQAGFLRPGRLGFLQQTMSLKNYRLELMGQIERKSLGWMFRAKDENNYYVAKLTVTRPGPLPLVDLVHYPVMGGIEGVKQHVTLPFSVRNDTLYQVEMNVKGDQYRASVNGHVVDSWTDGRLLAGGVGFISGQGEASRVRWIRVSDRDDLLGAICSYLSARYERPLGAPVLSAAANFAIFSRPGM